MQASDILGYDLLKVCNEGKPFTSTSALLGCPHVRREAQPFETDDTATCAAGPKEKLDSTVISQPAIYVASLAAIEKLRQDSGEVGVLLQHRLPVWGLEIRDVWVYGHPAWMAFLVSWDPMV